MRSLQELGENLSVEVNPDSPGSDSGSDGVHMNPAAQGLGGGILILDEIRPLGRPRIQNVSSPPNSKPKPWLC